MASPRSMWTGTISVGLLNVPITIGKASAQEREKSLVTLCATHHVPIDRKERCGQGDPSCDTSAKVRGVQTEDGRWRALAPDEYGQIEDATKSPTLNVLDVQPIWDLPIWYGTGTYYLRANDKVPGSEGAFGLLVATLMESMQGIVTKWCKGGRQDLAVIHAQDDLLLLTVLPYANELREPGTKERAHQKIQPDPEMVKMAKDLLGTYAKPEFDHAAYQDEGLKLRTEAVDRLLAGQSRPKIEQKTDTSPVPDLMAALRASMAQAQDPTVTMSDTPAHVTN